MNNINLVNNCCGCEICSNVCPLHVIEMKSDKTGFLIPYVDDRCVDCGICLRTCPMANTHPENNIEERYYGISNKDKSIVLQSASGGVFTFLYEEFLKQYPDGYICGVVYNDDFSGVTHIVSNELSEVNRMRSSKYLQSKKNNIFSKVGELLEKDCAVLFSGAPCEVDALKRFLGEQYEKLWTVDYVCKGTTTPKVLKDYVKRLENKYNSRVVSMNMRYKWPSLDRWIPQYLYVGFENGKHLLKQFYNTEVGLAFMILQRESCKSCPYREKKHYSDFTLADYHASIKDKEFGNSLGTSALIVNSNRAYNMWKRMDFSKLKVREISFDEVYLYNRNLQDERADRLKMNLEKYNGVLAVRKSIGIKEKIKMILPTIIMRKLTMKNRKLG